MKKLFSMLLGFLATAALTAVIGLPLAARAVTFTNATHIADGETTYEGQPITVDGCTLTVDGAHTFTNLYLVNNATLTHTAGAAGMMLTVSGTVWVATGSKIDVTACGGGPRAGTTGRSGGSYGGRGEPHGRDTSCEVYGDAFAPAELGSGGHTARGGGAVRITADTLQLDGHLRANGQNSGTDYNGGGSGGAIWLEVGTLQGAGSIEANGGLHSYNPWDSGDGGGGRVAVYYDDASGFDLTAIQCAAINDGAGAGTVYLKDNAEPFGRLTLDNRGYVHDAALPTALTVGSNRFDRLSVAGKARLALTATELMTLSACMVSNAYATFSGDVAGPDLTLINGDWTHSGDFGFSNTVVLSGASVLRHSVGDSSGLWIKAKSVNVSSNSSIDVTACGGGPRAGTTGRSGGSYGGRGEPFSGGTSCAVYGDAFAPAELGSGGHATTRGGGAVRITSDTLQINGTLRANGQNGAEYNGGGSGGSIWLEVSTLQGAGSIEANGGVHGIAAGDGGGGRVAVYARDTDGFAPAAVEAKSGGAGAEWGTVFLGVPRTVAVICTGSGTCDPAGPVVIAYGGTNTFAFTPLPVSLATNNTEITPAANFEWVNTGLWRGTTADVAWLAAVTGHDTLEAGFAALTVEQAAALPGGGMEVAVSGLAGWRYTLERRQSLTVGAWEPVPGQANILCEVSGPLWLSDTEVFPQAFYRVVAAR